MPKKSKRKRWSSNELNTMKDYVLLNKESLLDNFYKNIINKNKKYPKYSKFYTNLSKRIKRSSSQCKSKFQKMEREIYLDFLGVLESEFDLFVWTRKNKIDHRKRENDDRNLPESKMQRNLRHKEDYRYFSPMIQKTKKEGSLVKNLEKLREFQTVRVSVAKQFLKKRLPISNLDQGKSQIKIIKVEWEELTKAANAVILQHFNHEKAGQSEEIEAKRSHLMNSESRRGCTESKQQKKLSESLQW